MDNVVKLVVYTALSAARVGDADEANNKIVLRHTLQTMMIYYDHLSSLTTLLLLLLGALSWSGGSGCNSSSRTCQGPVIRR